MFVNTINRKTVEHIERTHPLRVTLCKIIIDSYDVNTITCEGIKEYWEGSNKGFTFTSSHLGNLTLMKNCTTEYLYVIVNHFPFKVVATRCPVVMVDSLVTINSDKVL